MNRLLGWCVVGAAAGLLVAVALGTAPASGAFSAAVADDADTAATAAFFTCRGAWNDPGAPAALIEWPLDEGSGTPVALGLVGGLNGTYRSASAAVGALATRTSVAAASTACPRDGGSTWTLDRAASLAGTGPAFVSGAVGFRDPTTFTIEIWVRTTSGGRLIGFGEDAVSGSDAADRMLYVNGAGGVDFGVAPGGVPTVIRSAAGSVADGAWHQVVASLSSSGMRLFLDGALVASDTTVTTAWTYRNALGIGLVGYWRVGWDRTGGTTWPDAPASWYLSGSLRYAGVWTTALTDAQIRDHYRAGAP